MRLAPFACSACGSRYWPDPDSSCELCRPSYEPEDRRRYCEVEAWEEWNDTETMMREEEQTENENQ